MKVTSSVRSTGMGAAHFTAVLMNHKWVPVHQMPHSSYLGRERGYDNYEIEVPDSTITAEFNRSNSGRETVDASNGLEWSSFDAAGRWAANQ